jgi:hypothetical protein
VGRRYDLHLTDKTEEDPGLLAGIREKASELLVHYPQPGLLLLRRPAYALPSHPLFRRSITLSYKFFIHGCCLLPLEQPLSAIG